MAKELRRFEIFSIYFVSILLSREASGNCSAKGDIVFLLDESGSVGSNNFEITKTFVYNFMSHFSIGPGANQFSVVTFESSATEVFSLNRYTTLSDLQSAVQSLHYGSGGTSIGSALDFARSYSFQSSHGARTDAAKLVILITDGQSSLSNEAELLKDQYVTIFCVGVTSGINEELLRNVSSHNDYTYISDSFFTLSGIQTYLAEKSCADQIDDCLSYPCQNGGTCEDQLGKYVCHCTGNTTDKNCYIPGLPTVTTGPGGTVTTGSSLTITCSVVGTYTAVFWEHQYNGIISNISTSGSSKYSGGTISTPSITIYNFSISDIGSYRCLAKNHVGTAHSPTMAFVDIPKSGINVTTVSPVSGIEGRSVTLTCLVSAIYPPAASVTWEFAGSVINTPQEGRYYGGNVSVPSLTITNLQMTDQGTYTCSATNLYRASQNDVQLNLILGLPTVTTGPGGTITTGSSLTITCSVVGTYTAVFWEHQYNGIISNISTSGSSKYSGGTISTPSITIYNFSISDIGSYRCSAKNHVGTAHSPTMAFVDIPKFNSSISHYSESKLSCESCGSFYDCTENSAESPCTISTWKLAVTAVMSAGALLGAGVVSYLLKKYQSRRSPDESDEKRLKAGPYIDFPQRDLGVQKMVFRM